MLEYSSISGFESVQLAIQTARSINARREKNGQPPRWTHIVEFMVDGHGGQACAKHGPEGHFLVWGDSEILASSAGDPIPIPEERR
jgi:hypothetical protein